MDRIEAVKEIPEARLTYIILNWRDNLDNTTMTAQGLAQTLMKVLTEEFNYQICQLFELKLPENPYGKKVDFGSDWNEANNYYGKRDGFDEAIQQVKELNGG